MVVTFALQDIEEVTLKMLARYSDRVGLHEVVGTVFLHEDIKNLLVVIDGTTVLVHHLNDELL